MKNNYNKIVIGIDQSYDDTGICVNFDDNKYIYSNEPFTRLRTNTQKRNQIKKRLNKILTNSLKYTENVTIICEKIRTFSGGFLSANYLISTGALVATIVDIAYEHGVKVYSVDTRSWKSKTVGTCKNKTKDKKLETIQYVENTLGLEIPTKTIGKMESVIEKGKKVKRRKKVEIKNDNVADAICISKYGFIPKSLQKLKEES